MQIPSELGEALQTGCKDGENELSKKYLSYQFGLQVPTGAPPIPLHRLHSTYLR
jgi:hypothetical protein